MVSAGDHAPDARPGAGDSGGSAGEGVVSFLRRLIRTPGLPGEEEAVAHEVAREMERLGYDEIDLDEAGNVSGRIRGRGEAPGVLLVTHLDHVEVGDPADWERPPFEGVLEDGRVWGRGAVDIKGPLAAQVHGAIRTRAGDGRPPGDVTVTALVQEEVGGLGARHFLSHGGADLILVGEPSRNELRRGHRGRVELEVRVEGRSAHASAPERGINPLFTLADFLRGLESLEWPEHPALGRATLAPTRVVTEPGSANVIPARARLICDARTIAGQTAEEVRAALGRLLDDVLGEGASGTVVVPEHRFVSYRGLEMEVPAEHPAFLLAGDHPAIRAAARTLEEELGTRPPVGVWDFATDGGHFAAAGHTVIGFAPGDERLAHTVEESIDVEELRAGTRGYGALAAGWAAGFLEAVEG